MRTRRWALWIVLGLLAFIALGALFGALSQSWETIGRVIGTGVAGGLAASFMIPLMGMAERPRLRAGAMAGMAYLALEAVLLILGIWLIDRGGVDYGERLLMAAGILAVTLLPTVAALFSHAIVASKRLPAFVILCSAAATILAVPLIFDSHIGGGTEEYAAAGVAIGAGGLMLLGVLMRRRGEPVLPGAVLSVLPILAVLATITLITSTWNFFPGSPLQTIGAIAVFAWCGAAVAAIWHASRLLELRGAQRHLRTAFGAAGAAGALLIGAAAWVESEAAGALGAACLVVAVCTLVAIAVFVRMNRRAELSTQLTEVTPGSIECPRCRQPMELRPGHGACASCGLAYRLELESPRCRRCRHDVTHSRSTICTECGEPILLPDPAISAEPSPA